MAKGVFFGFTLKHSRPHFIRAILEGIAFQYSGTMELLRSFGIGVKEASIVGGESRNTFWNQMKADVTGVPIKSIVEADAAALGAGILAGLATRVFKGPKEAVSNMVKVKKIFKPDLDRRRKYTIILSKYRRVYKKLEQAYPVII